MPIDTTDSPAAPTAVGVMSEELAGLVRDAAPLGLHVVLQLVADGGNPVRADLLAREVTDKGLRLKVEPLERLSDGTVIHGAATLWPGDYCDPLRLAHSTTYVRDGSIHTQRYIVRSPGW